MVTVHKHMMVHKMRLINSLMEPFNFTDNVTRQKPGRSWQT